MLTMWSRGLGVRLNSNSSYSNTGSSSTAVTPSSTRWGICMHTAPEPYQHQAGRVKFFQLGFDRVPCIPCHVI